MQRYLTLSNEILILTYEKAMKLELPKEFIELLQEEVEKRQLVVKWFFLPRNLPLSFYSIKLKTSQENPLNVCFMMY